MYHFTNWDTICGFDSENNIPLHIVREWDAGEFRLFPTFGPEFKTKNFKAPYYLGGGGGK